MNKKTQQARYGTFSTVITAIVLIIAVAVNLLIYVISERANLTVDLTSEKAFELTPEASAYLKTVDEQINIFMLYNEVQLEDAGTYFSQANYTLKQIAKQNSNIALTYVSIVDDPTFTGRFPQFRLAQGDIVIENVTAARTAHVPITSLFYTNENALQITSTKAESAICNGIVKVTSEAQLKACVLRGNDEFSAQGLSNLLLANNYTVEVTDILTSDIPADADLCVIVAPARDYDAATLNKLAAFLGARTKNRTLLYFADSEQPQLPNLEALLAEYGIIVEPGTAFTLNTAYAINGQFRAQNVYEYSAFDAGFSTRGLYPIVEDSRALRLTFDKNELGSTKTLLTMPLTGSGIMPAGQAAATFNFEAAIAKTPVATAVLSVRKLPQDSFSTNILAFGGAAFISEDYITSQSFANAEYLANALNELAGRKATFSSAPKRIGGSYLNITAQQRTLLSVFFMGVVPAVILAFGAHTWLKRRNR